MGKSLQARSAGRESDPRFSDELRLLAVDLNRQTTERSVGKVSGRWAPILLGSTLGVVAWRGPGAADWQIEGTFQGTGIDEEPRAREALRQIVEDADLEAGLEPVWVGDDRGAGWAIAGARLGIEHWTAARALSAGQTSTLVVVGRSRRRYTSADQLTLLSIAQLTLQHFESRRGQSALSQALEAQAGWAGVAQAAVEFASCTELDSLLNAIVRWARELCQTERSLLFLRDEASDELYLRAFAGIRNPWFAGVVGSRDLPSGYRRPTSVGFLGIAIRERRPIIVPDFKFDEQPDRSILAEHLQSRSSIAAPIFAGSHLIGAVTVSNRFPCQFGQHLADLLGALTRLAGVAILNLLQHEQAQAQILELQANRRTVGDQLARLERSTEMQGQLLSAAIDGPRLIRVVQVLANLIDRPVLLQDVEWQFLASAMPHGGESGRTDPAVRQIAGLPHLPGPPPRPSPDAPAGCPRPASEPPPIVFRDGWAIAPIQVRDETLGYLTVAGASDSWTDLELDAIRHAARAIGLQQVGERTTVEVTETLRGEFLRHLASGTSQSEVDLLTRARYLGHQLADRHVAVVIETPSTAASVDGASFLADVRRFVELTTGRILIARWDRAVVLLYPLPADSGIEMTRAFGRRLLAQLQSGWPDVPLWIGLGGVAPTLHHVKQSYEEARLAVRGLRAQGDPSAGGVLAWDDFGVVKLLLQANAQADLGGFARQILGRLIDYDRIHDAALIDTLRAYFAQSGNLESTARALHLHPHSLRYRLQRAGEISGLDLKDADCRLNVQLALKILEIERIARHG